MLQRERSSKPPVPVTEAAKRGALQRERLAELIDFVRSHSPLFRARYAGLLTSEYELSRLPIITRAELLQSYDAWVTDPRVHKVDLEAFCANPKRLGKEYLDHYFVGQSSGTTGRPTIFLHDRDAMRVFDTLAVRALRSSLDPSRLLGTLTHGGPTSVVIAGGEGHVPGRALVAWRRGHRPLTRRWLQLLSRDAPLPKLVAELNRLQPAVLSAHASILAELAEEQLAGELNIAPLVLTPTGEWLGPNVRRRLGEAFRSTVQGQYGAAESLLIGAECREGWLHTHDDWVVLEPVDAQGKPVPDGVASHTVLLTNLANRIQPLLRYDLGDSVTRRADACPCGQTSPAFRVHGHTADVLTFVDRAGSSVELKIAEVGGLVEATRGLLAFQVVQTEETRLLVRVDVRAGDDRADVWARVSDRLRLLLSERGVSGISLQLDTVPPQREAWSGKLRAVWSELRSPGQVLPFLRPPLLARPA
jgi:phenylacetate-coenzyme A ligase PaaK-like adenylate-forming protein